MSVVKNIATQIIGVPLQRTLSYPPVLRLEACQRPGAGTGFFKTFKTLEGASHSGRIKTTVNIATQRQHIITAIGQHIAPQAVAAFQGQAIVATGKMNGGGLVGPGVHGAGQGHLQIGPADTIAANAIGARGATGTAQATVAACH